MAKAGEFHREMLPWCHKHRDSYRLVQNSGCRVSEQCGSQSQTTWSQFLPTRRRVRSACEGNASVAPRSFHGFFRDLVFCWTLFRPLLRFFTVRMSLQASIWPSRTGRFSKKRRGGGPVLETAWIWPKRALRLRFCKHPTGTVQRSQTGA